jgi:hypothetical protein
MYDVYEMTILRRPTRRPVNGIMIVFTGWRMVDLGFSDGPFTEGLPLPQPGSTSASLTRHERTPNAACPVVCPPM